VSNKPNIKKVETEWKEAVNWFYLDKEIKARELQKLDELWNNAQPMTNDELYSVSQITWLSRCNWNLEPSITSLIEAIGKGKRASIRIGHNYSITEDRWKKVWAYYFTLKQWLHPQERYTGIPTLLDYCDPDNTIKAHITNLLGKKTKLKELYVELFSYFLEFQLMGKNHPGDSAKNNATKAAVESLMNEIKKFEYDEMILAAVQINPETLSEGKLRWYEVCHHKFFRRCDIIISTIGKNEWRGTFKERGSERKELKDLLLRYSQSLEAWISNQESVNDFKKSIHELLGQQTSKKLFQVSLLYAFLKGQSDFLKS
jgi:hypothetical protein